MSDNDYQSGYRGEQFNHGMDRAEYEKGKGQKELENTLGGGGSGGGMPSSSSNTTSLPFGLIILAPSMFMTYPAGGILALGIIAVICKSLEAFHAPIPVILIAFLIVAFPAYFFGIKVEKKVSQNAAYRVFRFVWRVVLCGMGIFAGALIKSLGIEKQRINLDMVLQNLDQSGGALLWTVILLAGLFWLLRKADRIYFPPTGVWEQDPNREVEVKSESVAKPRGALSRIGMSAVWFVPVVIVAHLILRLAVDACFGSTTSDHAAEELRRAFYQKNLIYLYVADVAAWLVLSVAGFLPGTGKKK